MACYAERYFTIGPALRGFTILLHLYILGMGRQEVERVGEAPNKVAGEQFLEGTPLRD